MVTLVLPAARYRGFLLEFDLEREDFPVEGEGAAA
jgi:hypothetical protein